MTTGLWSEVSINKIRTRSDEGMIDGPSTFAYLAFWSRRDIIEGILKPIKMTAWRGPGM
jgi:hypothetical protein